jgi:hypothetical protein
LFPDSAVDNDMNEEKAFVGALLEAPDVGERKLSASARMLRDSDRKLSAFEVAGLKDKVRRDHLNTLRQHLAESFPSCTGIKRHDFKKAVATPVHSVTHPRLKRLRFLNNFFPPLVFSA